MIETATPPEPPGPVPAWPRRLLTGLRENVVQLVSSMWRQFASLGLQQTASSLSLLTLMAMVPIAAVGLLVLTSLPAFEPMRMDVERFLASNLFLPAFSDTIVRLINQFVSQAERLSAIGTVVFFATALTAMLTIDQALNGIWRTPRPRPLAHRLLLYWAMLTIGPVTLGLALALHLQVIDRLPLTGLVSAVGSWLVPLVIATAALALLYRLAPNARVRWSHAIYGALFAVMLLEGLRRLFGLYISNFPSYTLIYGAFATLPLFLLWLYGIWMSLLLGALLTANLRFWGVRLGDPHLPTPSGDFDRLVRVVAELVRKGGERVPSLRFRADFDGDPIAVDRAAALLASNGYLIRVWPVTVTTHRGRLGVWDEYWLPAPDLADKSLRPLFDLIWAALPTTQPHVRARYAAPPTIDPAGERLTRPVGEVLAHIGPTRRGAGEPVIRRGAGERVT
jgi:membrane protein